MNCDEFKKLMGKPDLECCSSCHADMEYEYPTCFIGYDGQEWEVCCDVANAWREYTNKLERGS